MQLLKANTAIDVLIGPFVDATDGSTAEISLTLDVELSKNGQALANKNDVTVPTHDAAGTIDGHYNCELDATDTDTEGCLVLLAFDSEALIVRHEYMVLNEAAYDSLFAVNDTGLMHVDVNTTNANGIPVGAIALGAVTVGALGSDCITAAKIADNSIAVEHIAANAITAAKIATNAITNTQMADNSITGGVAGTLATGSIGAQQMGANSIGASELAADAVQEIVDGLLDETSASHVGAGTVGLTLDNLPNDGALSDLALIKTEADKIAAVTAGAGVAGSVIEQVLNIPTTAMRGTENAALATVCTELRLAELDPANLPTDIADIPTVSEFNARTILAANYALEATLTARTILAAAYFDPAVDDVDVRAIQANVITAAAINAAAIVAAKFGAGAIDAASINADAVSKIRDGILPTQNAAFNNMEFLFVAASDHVTPVTGAGTMAVTRSIDGAAFGAGTGTGPAEVGNGIYQYDASPADMNGGIITFRFTATSGTPGAPDDTFVTVVTGGGV